VQLISIVLFIFLASLAEHCFQASYINYLERKRAINPVDVCVVL